MVASFFRSKRDRNQGPNEETPFSTPFAAQNQRTSAPHIKIDLSRRAAAGYDVGIDDDDLETEQPNDAVGSDRDHEENEEDEEEDGGAGDDGITPLLPIFEASHLGLLRFSFRRTHLIR